MFLLCFFLLSAWAGPALCSVGGSVRFDYDITNQTTTDKSTGVATQSRSTLFDQMYTLNFERSIYPTLSIGAGANFQRELNKGVVDGGSSITSTTTLLNPYARVSFTVRPFSIGLNYNENITKTGSSGFPSSTMIQRNYYGTLFWSPYALPPLSLSYGRSHTFDSQHLQTDIVNDTLTYSTNYRLADLGLTYSGTYNISSNRLNLVKTKSFTNSIIASFNASLGRETQIGASYGIFSSHSTTETTVQSSGFVYASLIPYDAFSLKTDNIQTFELLQQNPYDLVNENRALIDGNTANPAAGNNGVVNIGTGGNPTVNSPLAYFYHVGIEFQDTPSSNAIFIYVNQNLNNIPNFNPDTAFSWSVYESDDDRTWSPVLVSVPGSFKIIDPLGQPASGFEIDLPTDIKAGWLQIVVSPISKQSIITVPPDKAGPLGNIDVTEVRAFERESSQYVNSRSSSSSYQNLNAAFSTIILEQPRLALTVNYTANSMGASSLSYIASGGVSLQQSFRITKTLTGTGSFYTQETRDPSGFSAVSLNYLAGLNWTPLPTLRTSLNYNGQTFFVHGLSQANSVFISNTAQLYQGINVYLNGGGIFPYGGNPNYLFSSGASITPYRTVALGLNYSENISTGQDGYSTKSAGTSISFSPFNNLFLDAALSWAAVPNASSTTTSYNVGWSPLQGGMLQLGFGYDEQLNYGLNGKTRTISSSASLRLPSDTFIDATYSIIESEDDATKTDGDSILLELRKML